MSLSKEKAEEAGMHHGSPRSELHKFLEMRAMKKSKTPEFQRQESWRYVRIHDPWRKPKGVDSHMRLSIKGWPALVKIGYRGPKEVRGLHPSGYRDVLVHNKTELEALSKDFDAARLAATVGRRKKIELAIRAKELGIRVLNGRGLLPSEVKAAPSEEEATSEKEEEKAETILPQEAEEKKEEQEETKEEEVPSSAEAGRELTSPSEEPAETPTVEMAEDTEKAEEAPTENVQQKKVTRAKKKPQRKSSTKKATKPKAKKKQPPKKKKKSKQSD